VNRIQTKVPKSNNKNHRILESEERITEPNRKVRQTKKKTPPAQQVFLGNITSLSEKTKKSKALVLLETHQTQNIAWLQHIKYKTHHNLASPTSKKGSHGGELVACRDHLNCTIIKQEVWNTIKEVSPVPIRIAAMILKINSTEFILGGIYLTEGEEFGKNNISIFNKF